MNKSSIMDELFLTANILVIFSVGFDSQANNTIIVQTETPLCFV